MTTLPPRRCTTKGCNAPTYRTHCVTHTTGGGGRTIYPHGWSDAFLAQHPTCADCGGPSKVADHRPTRAQLIAWGVPDPDDERYLVPLCKSCHSSRTAIRDVPERERGRIRGT